MNLFIFCSSPAQLWSCMLSSSSLQLLAPRWSWALSSILKELTPFPVPLFLDFSNMDLDCKINLVHIQTLSGACACICVKTLTWVGQAFKLEFRCPVICCRPPVLQGGLVIGPTGGPFGTCCLSLTEFPVATCELSQGAGQVPVMLVELCLCCTAVWAVLLSPESFSDSHLYYLPLLFVLKPIPSSKDVHVSSV